MKNFLAVVMVLCMASFVMAQPPQGQGKFGAGKGKFGDPAKMAEMHKKMMQRRELGDKPDVAKRPGPPPWAGKGMRMGGQRGPQPPFLGQPPKGFGPKQGNDLRRGGPKHKVPGYNPDCGWGRWQSGNSVGPHKGRGFKGGKLEGSNKGITIIIHVN
jgi:hypothetical protein